ncbi:hypothetical protein Cadr_000027261 [Camelus dromedarius]|uniref:Uncharacterized protein n=1 Tax=Camelus dromedarius TaxID=9838 RepID=A0A5N4CCE8_CAMDR|nr:hypothetical protein Cadr_000027261 [Camelus dromedarius]
MWARMEPQQGDPPLPPKAEAEAPYHHRTVPHHRPVSRQLCPAHVFRHHQLPG